PATRPATTCRRPPRCSPPSRICLPTLPRPSVGVLAGHLPRRPATSLELVRGTMLAILRPRLVHNLIRRLFLIGDLPPPQRVPTKPRLTAPPGEGPRGSAPRRGTKPCPFCPLA